MLLLHLRESTSFLFHILWHNWIHLCWHNSGQTSNKSFIYIHCHYKRQNNIYVYTYTQTYIKVLLPKIYKKFLKLNNKKIT